MQELIDTGAVRDDPLSAAVGRIRGNRCCDIDPGPIAGAGEAAGGADRRHHRDVHLGAVIARDMVRDLVQVVGEGVLGMGPLVQLREDITLHAEQRPGHSILADELDVILPVDLVAVMVLMPDVLGIPGLQGLIGEAEGNRPDLAVEPGAARIAPVFVAE